MPKGFDDCVKTPGSKKFTKALPDGQYVHGCRLPGSNKAVWGEVKHKVEKRSDGKYRIKRS